MNKRVRKPNWLKIKLPSGDAYQKIKSQRVQLGLSTVCEQGQCPNLGECWNLGTATFMLLGDFCTRACRFCSVKTAKNPPLPDIEEPYKLAKTIHQMHLKYAVLTTVDRDDLSDQGATHISHCIGKIIELNPKLIVEILMPDFQGQKTLIDEVARSGAQVISHNVECIPRLTSRVRDPRAGYQQSLQVLGYLKQKYPGLYTKSSLMLGWNETQEEVLETMLDIRQQGVDFLTIGQYLQPDKYKLPVENYIHPKQFDFFAKKGLELGFSHVASGPLVRSSYRAAEHYIQTVIRAV
jgi:lipoic acid synthetase